MKLSSADIKSIAVFRALQLGDLLCAVPFFRALRQAYPDAHITLLGLPWAKGFTQRLGAYFDGFIHFPGYEGLPEQPYNKNGYEQFVERTKKENFDLLIQLQGNGTVVNPVMFNWGAKNVAGYYNKESYLQSDLFMEYPGYGPEPLRHIKLAEHLGIPSQGDYLEYPVSEKDKHDFAVLQLPVPAKRYVCIHPGSRGAWRQWPPEYFAAVADYCAGKGLLPIITGTEEERSITQKVIMHLNHDYIDLTGKTSMGAIAILIANAFMLVSNCTGVSHIASATQTFSIVISMDGEPERWAPVNRAIHKVTDWTKEQDFNAVMSDVEELVSRYSN